MAIEEFESIVKSQIPDDDDVLRALWRWYETWDDAEFKQAISLLVDCRPHIIRQDDELLELARSLFREKLVDGPHVQSTGPATGATPADQPRGGE